MSQSAFFHEESEAVRFWVLVDGHPVGASISRATLHYRFRPNSSNEDPLETYLANEREIGDAVRARIASGSIEPVMVREFDLRAPVAQASEPDR
jgi:hypothetical protein